jgi:transposase-like protein
MGGRPYKMTAAKLRLAAASMSQPDTKVADLCAELGITRQTLYRHVSPNGEFRPDALRLLAGGKTSQRRAGPDDRPKPGPSIGRRMQS